MCNGLLRGISREGARRSRYVSRDTRGRTRTCNLLLRREAPYPLGHTGMLPGGPVQILSKKNNTRFPDEKKALQDFAAGEFGDVAKRFETR